MSNRPIRLVTLTLAICTLLLLGTYRAPGQDDGHHETHYNLASLRGNFGVVATYGANVARALGTQSCDGEGRLQGSALVNQPGPNDSRTISRITFTGTYTVADDGTGTMFLTIHLPNGQTAETTEDFVVTKARQKGGILAAIEMTDAQREPSAAIDGRVFVTHSYTRRPDGERSSEQESR